MVEIYLFYREHLTIGVRLDSTQTLRPSIPLILPELHWIVRWGHRENPTLATKELARLLQEALRGHILGDISWAC